MVTRAEGSGAAGRSAYSRDQEKEANVDTGMTGRRVLITGGAAGIGRVMAETFLRAGARVHIGDLDPAAIQQARAELPGLSGTAGDVASEADAARLVDESRRSLDGLDVLINNAGIPGPTAPVEEVSLAEWQRTLDVDITGMFLCTRAAVPLLKESGAGSIVNLSSAAGRFGFALRTPYAAAKWAVVGFTKSLSRELGPFDINVNAIQPGLVAGELQERVITAKAAARGIAREEQRAQLLQHVSMRRFVTQQEIADMALYLCSPGGHGVSGQAISVCGDQTALI
jgi:NAD(P)-dependent dehydrogenase (short-subunit alcohol dehydrogenase family)